MKAEKVLVLDVDETLLSMEPLFYLERFVKNYKQAEGQIVQFNGKGWKYSISPRPRLREFLEHAKKSFRLAAFSVASKEATVQKLQLMGVYNEFSRVYGQEDLADGKKDLRKVAEDFGVPLKSVIAIDDKPEAFAEAGNIVKVKSWTTGDSREYEFQSNSDNLFGAYAKALKI